MCKDSFERYVNCAVVFQSNQEFNYQNQRKEFNGGKPCMFCREMQKERKYGGKLKKEKKKN